MIRSPDFPIVERRKQGPWKTRYFKQQPWFFFVKNHQVLPSLSFCGAICGKGAEWLRLGKVQWGDFDGFSRRFFFTRWCLSKRSMFFPTTFNDEPTSKWFGGVEHHLYSPEVSHRTWKMMVGILLSFWEGPIFRVYIKHQGCILDTWAWWQV